MNRLSRYCDGLIEATWLLVIIVIPLYFLPSLEQPFGLGKAIMFRAIVLIGVAAWISKWVSTSNLRFEKKSISTLRAEITSQPLALLAGALATVYILSTIFSIAPLISLRGSYARFEGLGSLLSYILLFALIAANLRRRAQVDRLITTLAAVSFAIDLYAIMQHFGLDPLTWSAPWVGLASTRAVSTIGQPTFLAAFLGMTLMLILGRVVFLAQSYLRADTSRVTTIAHAALYLIVCALNLLSIWYSVARGSLIALSLGLFFFGFTLLVYWQLRRTFYVFAIMGIISLVFIATLNIPNGPISDLRNNPLVGPLGHMFDTETGTTGRIRVLIWNGMLRLVTPHDPIQLPGTHSKDRWNAIRPLIGYGPETIYLIYENYYVPEMFSMASYDLEHDHAHNEFWDVLAFYGLLGFLVEYGFFLSLIYFALKWLGWISSSWEHKLYWLLSLTGGLLGGIIALVSAGAEFLGIGIPLGLLLGAVIILFLRMFQHNTNMEPKLDPWRDTILMGSLALIIFHYVEILLGIPVNTSRILFWTTCAVMLTMGRGVFVNSEKVSDQNNTRQVGIRAGIIIAIVMAVTPIFISTNQFGQSISTIILNSLVSNSAVVLWMFLGIIFFTSLIFELESAALLNYKFFFRNLALLLCAIFFASFLVWMLYASLISATLQSPDLSPSQVVARHLNLINAQFGALFIFAYVWANLLPEPVNMQRSTLKPLAIAGIGLIHALALILSIFINLRPLEANGAVKIFNSYVKHSQYPAALEVGKRLLELDPWQDEYFLGVANITTDYANSLPSPQNIVHYLVAEKYYKQAYSLNPLFYRTQMGMANINRMWARASQDLATHKVRTTQAEQFYTDALGNKPYRVKLWVEWANFRAETGDFQGAQQKFGAALKIDNAYAPAYLFRANLYMNKSEKQSDSTKRIGLLDEASKDLTTGIEMMNRRGENPSLALLQLGNVYMLLQKYDQARESYLQAENLGLGDSQWLVYQNLAELSGKVNDIPAQREYLKQSIANAPIAEIPALQAKLDALPLN